MIKDQIQNQIGDLVQEEFDPLVISNLSLWLDASDFSTLTFNGSDISQWADKSGNNNNAIQATASVQPLYVANEINGNSILRFNGSTEFMTVPDDPTLRMGAGNFTIIAVVKTASATIQRILMKGRAGATSPAFRRYDMLIQATGAPYCEIDDNTHIHKAILGTTNIVNSANIVTMQRDGNDLRLLVNNIEEPGSPLDMGPYDSIDEDPPISLYIGRTANASTRFFDGDILTFLIYKKALNSNELDFINRGLENKWGI